MKIEVKNKRKNTKKKREREMLMTFGEVGKEYLCG